MVMFWVAILAISILLYVLLDGFDLGVGILFGLTPDEPRRRAMLSTVAPIWDGNETWLVVAGVVLWGAFPVVYSTLLSAFYLPLLLMLAGLILRGVAFEFRYKTERLRWIWDASFAGGSLVAAFIQGTAVGALVEGLPVSNGRYVGGAFGWFSPFAVLCGIGLCIGYSLLGACWLVKKSEGEVREAEYYRLHFLAIGLLAFLVIVFVYALAADLRVMARWVERPYLLVFPAIGAAATVALAHGLLRREDGAPFYMVALIFAAAFGTLAISFWPYMIPFSITIEEAAAPHSSLAFMFWGAGLFVFPLMLLYTAISYSVFRARSNQAQSPISFKSGGVPWDPVRCSRPNRSESGLRFKPTMTRADIWTGEGRPPGATFNSGPLARATPGAAAPATDGAGSNSGRKADLREQRHRRPGYVSASRSRLNQARANLQRTEIRSPVNGYVTNLLAQLGDYATVGTNIISLVDADSYWIDGYFEETNLEPIRVGDDVSIMPMGYGQILQGHVDSIARGIYVANAQPNGQGLASVNPIFTWVRLAQRIPVRIHIDHVPEGVVLVAGMTATVQIDPRLQQRAR